MNIDETKLQTDRFVQRWVRPAFNALHTMQLDLAAELIDAAKIAVHESELNEEALEACDYQVRFLYYSYVNLDEVHGWNFERFKLTLSAFALPANTALGEQERIKHLFNVRYHGDADGLEQLTRPEVDRFLEQISDIRAIQFCLEGWAFKYSQLDLLELCFELNLTDPSDVMGHARWQRVNLMYLLVAGRASRRDVEESIKTLAIKPQLQDFTMHIWPRCEAAGLVDDELRALLNKRSDKILLEKKPRYLEQRTKSILRKN